MSHWTHLGKYEGLPDTQGMSDALLDETIEAFWRTPLRRIAREVMPDGYELYFDNGDDIYLRPVGWAGPGGPYWLESQSDDAPHDWQAGGPSADHAKAFGDVADGLSYIARLARQQENQA